MSIFTSFGFEFIFRWIHFLAGITWIGMLYYMNFVQGAWFNEIKPEVKVAAQVGLLPKALWWFRWGAMFTIISGWVIISYRFHTMGMGYVATSGGMKILIGAILGTVMWYNVWFVIWPAQKIVIASAESVMKGGQANPAAAAAGAKAGLASRHNVLFSMPMLFFMGSSTHLPTELKAESLVPLWCAIGAIIAGLEFNALKGKLGPLTTVRGVIHMGVALTVVMYLIVEFLS